MATVLPTAGWNHKAALENFLTSMARTVENAVNRSLDALLVLSEEQASSVFLLEPRINEMETVIDDHAVRILADGRLNEAELRHIVATLKINNDLERMGDLAVNISKRVLALGQMGTVEAPDELAPMAAAVRSMVGRGLGALIYRNLTLAHEVLESDESVDRFRDRIFEGLLGVMTRDPSLVGPGVQFLLAARHLERIADHTTNIAEDIVFWLGGLDIRHRRMNDASSREFPGNPRNEL